MNAAKLAGELGVEAAEVERWVHDGCPHRRRGRGLSFDLEEVLRWRAERDESFNSYAAISRHYGVKETTARRWTQQEDFPTPWRAREVDHWLLVRALRSPQHRDMPLPPGMTREEALGRDVLDLVHSRRGGPVGAGDGGVASGQDVDWKAKREELKFKKEAGLLIEADQVERLVVECINIVKTDLVGLPDAAQAELQDLPNETLQRVIKWLADQTHRVLLNMSEATEVRQQELLEEAESL